MSGRTSDARFATRWGEKAASVNTKRAFEDTIEPEWDIGTRPSEDCEDGAHQRCDGYFTWIGPALCSCDCHD